MLSQTIYNGIVNIIPFWSNNIIQYLGLGNEYNLALNLILTEIIKIFLNNMNDILCFILFISIGLILVSYKLGYNFNINIFETNKIILTGIEKQNETIYDDTIKCINDYLIEVKKINNVTFKNNMVLINDITNFNINEKIYLTIQRQINSTSPETTYIIKYIFISYNQNINEFINKIYDDYKNKFNSELLIVGNEINNNINYPKPIYAINNYIISNYKNVKLQCMNTIENNNLNNNVPNNQNNNNQNNNNQNNNNQNNNITTENTFEYTITNLNNFKIDDINLTVKRENNNVYYYLKSKKINCKNWIENLMYDYEQKKVCKYKNKISISGREMMSYNTDNNHAIYHKFPIEIHALNWFIIDILKYQHYLITGYCNPNEYSCILNKLNLFKIEEDLFLSVTKEKFICFEAQKTTKENNLNNNDVIYTLYSDTTNLQEKLNNYVEQFKLYLKNKHPNKIIYHFTYNGLKNNELVFTHKILSEKNTNTELFETFDKIHNEHAEIFKNDIDKLKNIEYYKNHGLKRKKGYLFHGIPGCGKTSAVVAMALYDNRHIIEIPFHLLTTHNEFEKIMNLKNINGIEINNNNIIILFDEIDIGINKFCKRDEKNSDDSNKNINALEILSGLMTVETNNTNANLSLGTILSKLDGIGNYNGLITIATTNNIGNLDPALYRDMRLTPFEFKKLRKIDIINIIKTYFNNYDDFNDKYENKIIDRSITPTKLINLCQINENNTFEEFFIELEKNMII